MKNLLEQLKKKSSQQNSFHIDDFLFIDFCEQGENCCKSDDEFIGKYFWVGDEVIGPMVKSDLKSSDPLYEDIQTGIAYFPIDLQNPASVGEAADCWRERNEIDDDVVFVKVVMRKDFPACMDKLGYDNYHEYAGMTLKVVPEGGPDDCPSALISVSPSLYRERVPFFMVEGVEHIEEDKEDSDGMSEYILKKDLPPVLREVHDLLLGTAFLSDDGMGFVTGVLAEGEQVVINGEVLDLDEFSEKYIPIISSQQ